MDVPRNWRGQKARYSLVGARCKSCGQDIFPPRDVCPSCCSQDLMPHQFSGRGEVYSYSTVYSAPEGFGEQAPYHVALVRLEEGPLLTTQLTDVDPGSVSVGMPVEMVTRRLRDDGPQGTILYGYKFRPCLGS